MILSGVWVGITITPGNQLSFRRKEYQRVQRLATASHRIGQICPQISVAFFWKKVVFMLWLQKGTDQFLLFFIVLVMFFLLSVFFYVFEFLLGVVVNIRLIVVHCSAFFLGELEDRWIRSVHYVMVDISDRKFADLINFLRVSFSYNYLKSC